MRALLLCLMLLFVGCRNHQLQVRDLATPEYPNEARVGNIQGMVRVSVVIGPDGRVMVAKGSGAHPILVEAAEKNVRQWVFGPFPAVYEFPIYHTVTYVFKLEGPPAFVVYTPAIRTYLPDRIELQSRLFESDYPPSAAPRPPGAEEKKK